MFLHLCFVLFEIVLGMRFGSFKRQTGSVLVCTLKLVFALYWRVKFLLNSIPFAQSCYIVLFLFTGRVVFAIVGESGFFSIGFHPFNLVCCSVVILSSFHSFGRVKVFFFFFFLFFVTI